MIRSPADCESGGPRHRMWLHVVIEHDGARSQRAAPEQERLTQAKRAEPPWDNLMASSAALSWSSIRAASPLGGSGSSCRWQPELAPQGGVADDICREDVDDS